MENDFGFEPTDEVKLIQDPVAMRKTMDFEAAKYTDRIYKDPVGKNTIGYGFNIDDPTTAKLIPRDVLQGRRTLPAEEAKPIFQKLYSQAQKDAYNTLGSKTFLNLPPKVQDIVTDMSYQLGINKFAGFKKSIAALKAGDYATFGKEIKDSKWYKQSGHRSREHYNTVQEFVTPKGRVTMISPDGSEGHIPSTQIAKAIKLGYKRK